jgi:hypothetical protein
MGTDRAPSVNAANSLQEPGKNVVEYPTKSLLTNASRYAIAPNGIATPQVGLAN